MSENLTYRSVVRESEWKIECINVPENIVLNYLNIITCHLAIFVIVIIKSIEIGRYKL